MRNSLHSLALLGLLAGSVAASVPVHVALRSTAAVSADADGFFTLGSVAVLSGGAAAEREKFRKVRVGRAPLPDQVRQVTTGDVLLKLRQAGFDPETDAVVDGAQKIAVTVSAGERGPDAAAPVDTRVPDGPKGSRPNDSLQATPPHALSPTLVHRGDSVTILIQDGDMTISAKGVARDSGGAGDMIHVHRDGIMTDLSVSVVDSQTVQLEM